MGYRIWLLAVSHRIKRLLILEIQRRIMLFEDAGTYAMLTVVVVGRHLYPKSDIGPYLQIGIKDLHLTMEHIPSIIKDVRRRLQLTRSCWMVKGTPRPSQHSIALSTNYPYPYYFEWVWYAFCPMKMTWRKEYTSFLVYQKDVHLLSRLFTIK